MIYSFLYMNTSLSRVIAFAQLVLLALLSGQALSAAGDDAYSKPNIILILADDLGYGDLSAHGNPVLKTPEMDKLHDSSVRFTDFHVAPKCTPGSHLVFTPGNEILHRCDVDIITVTT